MAKKVQKPAEKANAKLETKLPPRNRMYVALQLIAREREEMITKHGFTVNFDIERNQDSQLIDGAVAMLYVAEGISHPFPETWDKSIVEKLEGKSPKEALVIAASLIAAEIDRRAALEDDAELAKHQEGNEDK